MSLFSNSSVQAVLLTFLWICPFAAAFDAGDGIALTLGLVLTVMGIFACLGMKMSFRSIKQSIVQTVDQSINQRNAMHALECVDFFIFISGFYARRRASQAHSYYDPEG